MARRKRLTPPSGGYPDEPGTGIGRAPETKAMTPGLGPAPIAQVAGDAASRAALEELSAAVQTARADGRLIERLPLAAIDEDYLVRDRMEQDADEMEALLASLTARGQQTAIEVARLDEGRYGLISGWRRLTALRRLHEATGEDRFASVKALVVAPDSAQAAYVAMVEENEIRVNLSFYERARIALKALQAGLYPTQRAALQGLYASTTRAKRSKIGSFVTVVEALDDALRHPTAITERLGLALAKEITRDPGFVSNLRVRLASAPDRNAGEEMAILLASVKASAAPAPATSAPAPEAPAASAAPAARPAPERAEVAPGLVLKFWAESGRIQLTGPGVDADLCAALADWLAARG